MIIQQLINGLMLGSTYSLVAIGYTLIFGVLGLLHFAHGEVLMAGAFMGLYIILWSGLPLYIALPLTMIVTGLLGLIIEFLAIRPLRKDFHLAPLLSTIGVTIILQNLAVKIFGGYGTKFPDPIAMYDQFGETDHSGYQPVAHGSPLFGHCQDQIGQGHAGGGGEPSHGRFPRG
jgi:branched-chain amino acid transport system permease protein